MLRVGVIGCGYWGPNLIRNFVQLGGSEVVRVADLDESRLQRMRELYPGIGTTIDHREVVEDPSIDIVVVATPVRTHHPLALSALRHGKHVLVEKPLAASVREAEELVAQAGSNGCRLMVGHTFLYTSAVRKMKEIIDSGELGEIYYISSQRLNLGLFQQDINVIWDLAPHDVSIILYLLGRQPVAVSAVGASHINPSVQDVAILTMEFDRQVMAFVQSSWLDPDKIRKMTIVGSRKMMVYDDVQPTEKIRIYDKGVEKPKHYDTYAEFPYSYKYGDIIIPRIDGGEPLRAQVKHLVDSIQRGEEPLTDGRNGLEVVRILEAAQKSLDKGNNKVYLGGK